MVTPSSRRLARLCGASEIAQRLAAEKIDVAAADMRLLRRRRKAAASPLSPVSAQTMPADARPMHDADAERRAERQPSILRRRTGTPGGRRQPRARSSRRASGQTPMAFMDAATRRHMVRMTISRLAAWMRSAHIAAEARRWRRTRAPDSIALVEDVLDRLQVRSMAGGRAARAGTLWQVPNFSGSDSRLTQRRHSERREAAIRNPT